MKHGAPELIECVADDVKPGETVVFSWIVMTRSMRDREAAPVQG